jgi:light-regulated signal transduction histidine kinase (bacteriophytochrome)
MRADHTELAGLRKRGFIYAMVAVLIAAGFALALSSTITHQLRLLLAGAERMSHDVLDEPVPVVTENDVGVVARGVNLAMEKLRHERTRLKAAHAKLQAEVAERRRAEAQLQVFNDALANANEQLRQFAYAASHDLQEPLRSVTAYSQLLRTRYRGKLDTDADEFIEFIHSGATRMQRLIKALLEYSRAGGPGEEPAHSVSTIEAMNMAVENLSLAIEDSDASIQMGELPSVLAHEIAVVQLFQNLIGNAIKYRGDRRPEIRVSAERGEGDRWVFSVADNGIGIDPSQHRRVFGLFKRAHGTQYPGTGVGLAICVKLVDRYGGRIWVESQPGVGSTFRFTLPADQDAVRATSNHVAA